MSEQARTRRNSRVRACALFGLMAAGVALLISGAIALSGALSPSDPATAATVPTDEQADGKQLDGARLPAPRIIEPRVRLSTNWYDASHVQGEPVQVKIPDLGITVPVYGIDATDGILVPPADPRTLGWWRDGAEPGARTGSAVITGHTVHTGGGALDKLKTLQVGDQVYVGTTEGQLEYDVRQVRDLTKQELADQASEIFDSGVAGRLVLITCSEWNGTEYLSNTVVYASPVAAA